MCECPHPTPFFKSYLSRTLFKNISKLAKTNKKNKTLEALENAGKIEQIRANKNKLESIENA
ncbi:MAG: hypothetical protein Q7J76_09360 [Candidatus Brocadiaceae bacterium]|nr:hypothetical protein [Candidatus Brocadiaceae bacterium]